MRVGTRTTDNRSGKGGDVRDEVRKRMVDVCCFQEVRWSGQVARILGVKGRSCGGLEKEMDLVVWMLW